MKTKVLILSVLFSLCLFSTLVYGGGKEKIEKGIQAEKGSNYITLDDLYQYNLIALQDADVNCHVRGSLWIGGTLTGNQYVDDGSLNGTAASDSYVRNNQSNIYFKSRTNDQSLEAFLSLDDTDVENSINYWSNIIDTFPQNDNFVYVQPDENGYVNLKTWDYQASGGDTSYQEIPKVYYTDATTVEIGGLAGHLIAPFADINIVSCNHCGSIVGWNIYTDGESHINYWIPYIEEEELEEPEEEITPTPPPEEEIEETPTPTPTEQITETPTPTPTEEVTPTPTEQVTQTPTPTPKEEITETPTPTEKIIQTPTPSPTQVQDETPTPTPQEEGKKQPEEMSKKKSNLQIEENNDKDITEKEEKEEENNQTPKKKCFNSTINVESRQTINVPNNTFEQVSTTATPTYKVSDSPKTGDTNSILFWVFLISFSLFIIRFVFIKKF